MQMPSPCTASEVRCVKRELLCMEISRLSVTLQMKDVWCVTAELGGLLWVENTPHTQNAHTLTHTHALTQACTVCDSFVSTLSVLLSLMNISLVASPTEFAPLAGSLPHIQFFNRDGSENGHVISTNLCESLKKSALVFFCWHYSNLVSFLSPGYTWSITQWFIFKSGSIFSPFSGPETKNVENFCQKKKKVNTKRDSDRCYTHTHSHTAQRGNRKEEVQQPPPLSPPCTQMFRHPLSPPPPCSRYSWDCCGGKITPWAPPPPPNHRSTRGAMAAVHVDSRQRPRTASRRLFFIVTAAIVTMQRSQRTRSRRQEGNNMWPMIHLLSHMLYVWSAVSQKHVTCQ